MQKTVMLLAAFAVMACGRTADNDASDRDSVGGDVDIGLTRDTVNVPVFSTEKDTIIVDKPVVSGRKPVEIKRPTLDDKP